MFKCPRSAVGNHLVKVLCCLRKFSGILPAKILRRVFMAHRVCETAKNYLRHLIALHCETQKLKRETFVLVLNFELTTFSPFHFSMVAHLTRLCFSANNRRLLNGKKWKLWEFSTGRVQFYRLMILIYKARQLTGVERLFPTSVNKEVFPSKVPRWLLS